MWILDSEGDFLAGKRVWLRPGKKYLFGRVKKDGVNLAIQHVSVSRKHLVIEVSPVTPGDGSQPDTRSEVSVTDQNSKAGTTLDGENIRGKSKKLDGEEHFLRLGKSEHPLRIKWVPVVFSFFFRNKIEAQAELARIQSRFEDLDIKAIDYYAVGCTTHVVQRKRNTPMGLQALVNGKYIVKKSYLDKVEYAATPSDMDNPETLCGLETDFDAAWPDPSEDLPPPGKEPVPRPANTFAPNPNRSTVFKGYTFVFVVSGDETQFKRLQAPINNGHGKTLRYNVEKEVTTSEEIAQFMRNTPGYTGHGADRDKPGGVVLVQFRAERGDCEDWLIELSNQVALMTNQRVIEQSEFLDAILANDASPLCRPLRSSTCTETAATDRDQPASQPLEPSQSSQPESSQAAKPRSRSQRERSKIKTFDDGFDIDSIPVYTPDDALPPPIDEPPVEEQTGMEEDPVSSLLPGASAMKRRRAETEKREQTPHIEREATPKPKRQKLDVLEAARQHREAEEGADRERRQAEDASLHASLKDVNVEKLKNLAIVEEMEIPARERPARTHTEDNRWDENWNGRKNFKKFRRKGQPNQPRSRIQTVIVPLEEVTRQEVGYGDHHWVTTRNSPDPSHSYQQSVASRKMQYLDHNRQPGSNLRVLCGEVRNVHERFLILIAKTSFGFGFDADGHKHSCVKEMQARLVTSILRSMS
ncbi:hypothetical protein PHISCL_03890 [Aspergillus sclerotialis]|uniref:FHA domain-containing protein n=1 Tax=Aspergillus sclerotialis TaxID=2070753 RepID=A0A3A2ZMB8_9EURO|nr:hypothetical protein PHISCL_03890 [Aspergillus sclerotialis]